MFYSGLSQSEISKRIVDFRVAAESGISYDECVFKIGEIFGSVFSFPLEMRNYPSGKIFFRARAIEDVDSKIPFSAISKVSDAWAPPPELVRNQGRLNNVGQSVLYCCPGNLDVAIDEARARENNFVAIISYKARRKVNVSVIGDYKNSSLPRDPATSRFYSFLDEEFSRFAPKGGEARYVISRAVAETFFSYPEQDAWCYRSVQSSENFNTAFLPERAGECLELIGVLICDLRGSNRGVIQVRYVVNFDMQTGLARYHHPDSQIAERMINAMGLKSKIKDAPGAFEKHSRI